MPDVPGDSKHLPSSWNNPWIGSSASALILLVIDRVSFDGLCFGEQQPHWNSSMTSLGSQRFYRTFVTPPRDKFMEIQTHHPASHGYGGCAKILDVLGTPPGQEGCRA